LGLRVDVFLLAFSAALNPTLLAATTVLLLVPNPKKLMLGYLLGAMMTSITLGLVIVFSLQGSGAVSTAQNVLSPAANFALGMIAFVVARALRPERRARREERKAAKGKKKDKGPPRWQRALSEGKPRDTFVVGALLTLPGASYLVALNRIAQDELSTAEKVLSILTFNVIMLALLEVPFLAEWLAPETTPERVDRFKASVGRNGRRIGITVANVIAVLFIVRGAIELLT
jgi:hypothetical protein